MKRTLILLAILVFAGTVHAGPVPPFVTLFMRTVLDDPTAAEARATLAALGWSSVPASASAAGTAGDLAYDSDYLYVAVSDNTWKRAALTTWVPTSLGFLKKVDGGYLRQTSGGKIDLQ